VLSFFRTEIHNEHTNETTGNMVNTPAMTSAIYGEGRVVLNSPHPELPPEEPPGGASKTRPEIYEGELAWVLRLVIPAHAPPAPPPGWKCDNWGAGSCYSQPCSPPYHHGPGTPNCFATKSSCNTVC
jgi:hypothetical protein